MTSPALARAANLAAYDVVDIDGAEFYVARTDEQRRTGLAGLVALDKAGMLFVNDAPTSTPFTMEGVQFPLHIAFYDAAGELIRHGSYSPGFAGPIFCSGYTYVVEMAETDWVDGQLLNLPGPATTRDFTPGNAGDGPTPGSGGADGSLPQGAKDGMGGELQPSSYDADNYETPYTTYSEGQTDMAADKNPVTKTSSSPGPSDLHDDDPVKLGTKVDDAPQTLTNEPGNVGSDDHDADDNEYPEEDFKTKLVNISTADLWAVREIASFTADQRKKAAASGAALPDGSFPIVDQKSLDAADHLKGNSKNHSKAEVQAHINKRAKALGLKVSGSDKK